MPSKVRGGQGGLDESAVPASATAATCAELKDGTQRRRNKEKMGVADARETLSVGLGGKGCESTDEGCCVGRRRAGGEWAEQQRMCCGVTGPSPERAGVRPHCFPVGTRQAH